MKIIKNKEKNSITYFKTIESKNGLSLLEVYPKTGRTHQIRVHLLSENCPILGDKSIIYLIKKKNLEKITIKCTYMLRVLVLNLKEKI